MRFPLQCVAHLKLLTFHSTTALQRKLSMRRVVTRLYTVYRLPTLSFHFSSFGISSLHSPHCTCQKHRYYIIVSESLPYDIAT